MSSGVLNEVKYGTKTVVIAIPNTTNSSNHDLKAKLYFFLNYLYNTVNLKGKEEQE